MIIIIESDNLNHRRHSAGVLVGITIILQPSPPSFLPSLLPSPMQGRFASSPPCYTHHIIGTNLLNNWIDRSGGNIEHYGQVYSDVTDTSFHHLATSSNSRITTHFNN